MTTWRKGEKSDLAREAKVSPGQITYYLQRKKRANPETALRLEAACKKMRLPITKTDWIYSKETTNPYFEGEAITGV